MPDASNLPKREDTESVRAQPVIVIDLMRDWTELQRSQLTAAGYEVNSEDTPQRISITYFNVVRRQIARRPRRVLRPAEFSCPDALRAGLSAFVAEAERGEPLFRRQSKQILNAEYDDGLLNDWDIHHFHLGTEPDRKNPHFVARTKQVLFARVTDDCVYLIEVAPHGAWSKQRFVKIIHANWPQSIEHFHMKGVLGMERTLSDDDIGQLRGAGITTFVEVAPGIVYAPIGGGQMTSRVSTNAVMESDRCASLVLSLQAHVRAHADEIMAATRRQGLVVGSPPEFQLILRDGCFGVREKHSGVCFLFPEE